MGNREGKEWESTFGVWGCDDPGGWEGEGEGAAEEEADGEEGDAHFE
jgi:hypothetical protein